MHTYRPNFLAAFHNLLGSSANGSLTAVQAAI
jgi:hypothetical protein